MRWKVKPLICFWLSCVVLLSSAWNNVHFFFHSSSENFFFFRVKTKQKQKSSLTSILNACLQEAWWLSWTLRTAAVRVGSPMYRPSSPSASGITTLASKMWSGTMALRDRTSLTGATWSSRTGTKLSLSPSLSLSHTHTRTRKHARTHARTHAHTHTHTHTHTLSLSLSLLV